MADEFHMDMAREIAQAGLNKFNAGTPEYIVCRALLHSTNPDLEDQRIRAYAQDAVILENRINDMQLQINGLTTERFELMQTVKDCVTRIDAHEVIEIKLTNQITALLTALGTLSELGGGTSQGNEIAKQAVASFHAGNGEGNPT